MVDHPQGNGQPKRAALGTIQTDKRAYALPFLPEPDLTTEETAELLHLLSTILAIHIGLIPPETLDLHYGQLSDNAKRHIHTSDGSKIVIAQQVPKIQLPPGN